MATGGNTALFTGVQQSAALDTTGSPLDLNNDNQVTLTDASMLGEPLVRADRQHPLATTATRWCGTSRSTMPARRHWARWFCGGAFRTIRALNTCCCFLSSSEQSHAHAVVITRTVRIV